MSRGMNLYCFSKLMPHGQDPLRRSDIWPFSSGRELQQQVAQLQSEYTHVGDQLESEQTRILQVLPCVL